MIAFLKPTVSFIFFVSHHQLPPNTSNISSQAPNFVVFLRLQISAEKGGEFHEYRILLNLQRVSCLANFFYLLKVGIYHPPGPSIPVANEGLAWDSLLKRFFFPGSDWNPGGGGGVNPS